MRDPTAEFYLVSEKGFPTGLSCMECERPIPVGAPFSQRLDYPIGDDYVVSLVCVYCAVEKIPD